MLTRTLSLSWSSLISAMVPLKSANGPFPDPDGLAELVLQPGPALLGRCALAVLGLDLEDVLDLLAGQRGRAGAEADEAGHAGRVAHHVPGVVVEVEADQQVAGEDLLRDDLLLAVLELDDVLHGDDDLEDALLHVHGGDAALEVGLHLVLVAGVAVDHEPVAGPVVGALRRAGGSSLGLGLGLSAGRLATARSPRPSRRRFARVRDSVTGARSRRRRRDRWHVVLSRAGRVARLGARLSSGKRVVSHPAT